MSTTSLTAAGPRSTRHFQRRTCRILSNCVDLYDIWIVGGAWQFETGWKSGECDITIVAIDGPLDACGFRRGRDVFHCGKDTKNGLRGEVLPGVENGGLVRAAVIVPPLIDRGTVDVVFARDGSDGASRSPTRTWD